MAEDKNQTQARQQDVLKQPTNPNRKVVREQKIALIQRPTNDKGEPDGTVRLSFEPDEHGARPGPMTLDAAAAKSIPESGDDRGYLVVYDDGSQEWKPSSEVEKK